MELGEIMRTQHACRYFRPDSVGDDVLYGAIEMARFAPNGGNRNAVRFVLVRDPAIVLKRELTFVPFYGWYLMGAGMISICSM